MTLTNQYTGPDQYTGDGSTTVFATTFPFYATTELKVYLVVDGVGTLQSEGADYSVSGGDGAVGSVTFTTAPTASQTVEINRFMPYTQETDYPESGKFPAASHETALDKIVMTIQQLASTVGLSTFTRAAMKKLGLKSTNTNLWDAEAKGVTNATTDTTDNSALATVGTVNDLIAAGGSSSASLSYGETVVSTPAATSVTTSWAKAAGTTTLGNANEVDANSANNRLRYTGTITKKFLATLTLSASSDTAPLLLSAGIGIDGSDPASNTEVRKDIDATADEDTLVASQIIELSNGSYIEAFLKGDGSASVTVQRMTLTLVSLESASTTGTDLPDVTGSDNDSLMVVNGGAWTKRTAAQVRTHLGLGTAALGTAGVAAGNQLTIPSDPGADRILFWDDSDNAIEYLTLGTGLSITGNTINVGGVGGQLQLIESVAVSSDTSIDFTTSIDSTYAAYLLVITGLVVQADDVEIWLRISDDGGSTWKSGATDYSWCFHYAASDGGTGVLNDNSDSEINLAGGTTASAAQGNASGEHSGFHILINNPSNAALPTSIEWTGSHDEAAGPIRAVQGAGRYNTAAAIDGIRILAESGNLVSGRMTLFGLKHT